MNNPQSLFNWRSKKAPSPIRKLFITEKSTRYEFDVTISALFLEWSIQRRQQGLRALFSEFYNELSNEHRNHVTLTF